MRHVYIYRFRVRAEHEPTFVSVYGADGAWAALFRTAAGFLGTQLLRDTEDPGVYLTLDSWSSHEQYSAFREQWRGDYETLDQVCLAYTEDEQFLGHYVEDQSPS